MPIAIMVAPTLEARAPDVYRIGDRVALALPVVNSGDATASALTITSVAIGNLPRLEPALPYVLGVLAPNNIILVNAIFSSSPQVVTGGSATVSIHGTYAMCVL